MTATFECAIVAGQVRLDIYGEVHESGRIATFLSRDEALQLSRELSRHATRILLPQPTFKKNPPPRAEPDTEELV